MNYLHQHDDQHVDFYNQTIARVDDTCNTSEELCFVYVQHAFSTLIPHLNCLGDRFAALLPKSSSAKSNRGVVKELETHFPGKVFDNIHRGHLRNEAFTLNLLKKVTRGRPFAILEYGGYFAPCAEAINNDPDLGPRLMGFVEGTENGIKGADDSSTIGYQHVAHKLSKPIVSKSKSRIKLIMDADIGPAILESCNDILKQTTDTGIGMSNTNVGVVGLGSIGKGILQNLGEYNAMPFVYDKDIAVMAELAHNRNLAIPLESLLAKSDLIFLNTGSCFLAQQPELLAHIKDDAILVLCTSGDVEAGIPQLVEGNHIQLAKQQSNRKIASYTTRFNKSLRVMLGGDSIGQAPNLAVECGSKSLANLMSDMEFYALGCYLEQNAGLLPTGQVIDSPSDIQDIIFKQWLETFHPESQINKQDSADYTAIPARAASPSNNQHIIQPTTNT